MTYTRQDIGRLVGIRGRDRLTRYTNIAVTLMRAEEDGWLVPSVRSGNGAGGNVDDHGAIYNAEDVAVARAVTQTYPIRREYQAHKNLARRRVTLAGMVREAFGHRWLCFSEDDALVTDDEAEVLTFYKSYPADVVRVVDLIALDPRTKEAASSP